MVDIDTGSLRDGFFEHAFAYAKFETFIIRADLRIQFPLEVSESPGGQWKGTHTINAEIDDSEQITRRFFNYTTQEACEIFCDFEALRCAVNSLEYLC